ncbi:hypothetical protein [Maribacter arenosus]|uniref:Uncharacterized protein n=1 Tax=Maribacter arenosus TaxID=1854708 RepID=A0ABR7V8H1_9FLAO|nr:hypothetical protein [Maribacter arenosus]MBD0849591.1 hypothetical protein [Maribacter arenosus]
MDLLREYFIQWMASNTIAILLLIASFRRPKLARLVFSLLFAWACWLNYTTAHHHPEDYLNYASMTPFVWVRDFINDWFKGHITGIITVISVGQGLIALGMLLQGWWVQVASVCAILFLLAIIPLGIGSGFPCSLILALAVYIMLKKDDLDYVWKIKKRTHSH